MHLSDLKNLHVGELLDMAVKNEVDGANRLRKQELIFAQAVGAEIGRAHV